MVKVTAEEMCVGHLMGRDPSSTYEIAVVNYGGAEGRCVEGANCKVCVRVVS